MNERMREAIEKIRGLPGRLFNGGPGSLMPIDLNLLRGSVWRDVKEYGYFYHPLLMSAGITPTKALIEFIDKQGNNGLVKLKSLQRTTSQGQFNPTNSVQKDLEFGKYLNLSGEEATPKTYRRFRDIEFLSEEQIRGRKEEAERIRQAQREKEAGKRQELDRNEQLEAESAAYEAAIFFQFVKERVEAGRQVIVLGNKRYGAYFVVEPLRGYLDNMGVKVGFPYVISSFSDPSFIPELPESLYDFIITQKPNDIIIVDGTKNSYEDGKSRFPRSVLAWLNWFRAKELDFQIAHWLPNPTEEILIGNQGVSYFPAGREEDCVILANPVIDPKHIPSKPVELFGHRPAYFDDPDLAAQARLGWPFLFNLLSLDNKIVFSSNGVQRIFDYRDGGFREDEEEILVRLVQQHMESVMPEMIERTQNVRD